MPRRKTYRVRNQSAERRLHLRVTSPRIVGFGILRTLRRFAKFAVLGGLACAAAWGAKTGLHQFFVENDDEFRLREIQVETNGALTKEQFAVLTQIDISASMFAFHLDDLTAQLLERPGIVSAEVTRRLPGTLRVKVEERVPVAWLECQPLGIVGKNPDSGLLLDKSGICFPCEPWWEERARLLPVVLVSQADDGDISVGKSLRHHEGRRALELLKLTQGRLSEFDWSIPVVAVRNEYSLLATTSDGLLVTFGMYGHERQVDDLISLITHTTESGEEMTSVNLIPSRNIPVRMGPTAPEGGFVPDNRLEREIRFLLDSGTGGTP